MTGDADGDDHQQHAGPDPVPEQERQRKGKDGGAVIARERAVRRMCREGIANAGDERALMRQQRADGGGGEHGEQQRDSGFATTALRCQLALRPHSHRPTISSGTMMIRSRAKRWRNRSSTRETPGSH